MSFACRKPTTVTEDHAESTRDMHDGNGTRGRMIGRHVKNFPPRITTPNHQQQHARPWSSQAEH